MKSHLIVRAAAAALLVSSAYGQTINWGSEAFSVLVDSKGNQLSENDYVFELGAFSADFTPVSGNIADWFLNWKVFDRASYESDFGYFTSTVQMTDIGGSSYAGSSVFDFEGLPAYIWIRNASVPNIATTEWLLLRDSTWTFPNASTGCCEPDLPLQWSISDLNAIDVPKYGYQSSTYKEGDVGALDVPQGTGLISYTGPSTLQTASFVPEPTSAALIVMLGVLGLTRRQREGKC